MGIYHFHHISIAYITYLIILYHLSCVELEIKLQKWLCAACKASGQVRGGKCSH